MSAHWDDAWYADIIDRYAGDEEKDGANIALAILAAACIMSQSIEALAKAIDKLEPK